MEPLASSKANLSCSDHFPKLFVLIARLPYSAPEEGGPNHYFWLGPIGRSPYERSGRRRCLLPTLISSSDPTPGIVRSRQRFAHRSRGRKKPQPLTAGASWQSGSNVGIRPFRSALKSARSLENSLFFPLLQGILEPRDQLAHDCHHHHAVRCEPMFPGLRQIARNLRAFPRVQMRDVRSLSPAEVAIASILAAGL
jgi:hypothetical protein